MCKCVNVQMCGWLCKMNDVRWKMCSISDFTNAMPALAGAAAAHSELLPASEDYSGTRGPEGNALPKLKAGSVKP